jgi:hypothetical protein
MNSTSILNGYVTDMVAVEKHILEAVERQLTNDDTRKYPVAVQALGDLKLTLARHVDALEAFNDGTPGGGILEKVKEAATGALGVAAGVYNQIRQTDAASRSVRDTYTALGLATVSYEMLFTTALALKNQSLADLALRHLEELAPHTIDLSKVVCLVVVQELTDEDKTLDPSVGDEAVRKTREAWRRASQSGGDGASGTLATPSTIGSSISGF